MLNNLQVIDNISEITKSTVQGIEEKAFSSQNNQSDETLDYSTFKFPLNNTDFNLLMPETRMGSSDNLSNIIFLEFDMNNNSISKEHLKFFKEINNEYVEKEIHFVLNVYIN